MASYFFVAGPSEKYWEVIAERRRKALEDVLDQNRKLCDLVKVLEEENLSCKILLEESTDLINTIKVRFINIFIIIRVQYLKSPKNRKINPFGVLLKTPQLAPVNIKTRLFP